MSDKVIKLINGLLFYIIWWGCVLGVKYSYNFLGPILTILAGMFHIYLIKNTKNEMKLKLEQLRALENKINIDVFLTNNIPLGVDTEKDYMEIKKLMEYKS